MDIKNDILHVSCRAPNFRKGINFLFIFLLFLTVINFRVKGQSLPTGFSQVQVAANIISPTVMAFAPDGRIFVAQQTGELRIIKNGVLLPQPFISLSVNSAGERGLLGIAFDPAFAANQRIYLYYTLASGSNNRISRFTANGDLAVPGSELVLLDLDPLSSATNHNGGSIQFGIDGKLYVGVGENANSANSQNLDTYLGKILRIKSDGGIPAGNPFTTGSAQKKRVWSYGVRNPFTLAVQPGSGKIYVNDVGNSSWEEINNAKVKGLNFGWPTAEGNGPAGYTDPTYTYSHSNGCAITGGTFFNPVSTNYPAKYKGRYFFIDLCGNWIQKLTINGSIVTQSGFATGIAGSPVGIVTGTDGNLYFLSRDNSAVYKIIYNGARIADDDAALALNNSASIQVSPNPATEYFEVNIEGSSKGAVMKLFDLNGRLVKQIIMGSSTYERVSLAGLESGVYFLVIENNNGVLRRKLIIEK